MMMMMAMMSPRGTLSATKVDIAWYNNESLYFATFVSKCNSYEKDKHINLV